MTHRPILSVAAAAAALLLLLLLVQHGIAQCGVHITCIIAQADLLHSENLEARRKASLG